MNHPVLTYLPFTKQYTVTFTIVPALRLDNRPTTVSSPGKVSRCGCLQLKPPFSRIAINLLSLHPSNCDHDFISASSASRPTRLDSHHYVQETKPSPEPQMNNGRKCPVFFLPWRTICLPINFGFQIPDYDERRHDTFDREYFAVAVLNSITVAVIFFFSLYSKIVLERL